jgi:hypothetical protein
MKEGILEIQTVHDDRKGHHYYTRRRSIVVMTLAVIMVPLLYTKA